MNWFSISFSIVFSLFLINRSARWVFFQPRASMLRRWHFLNVLESRINQNALRIYKNMKQDEAKQITILKTCRTSKETSHRTIGGGETDAWGLCSSYHSLLHTLLSTNPARQVCRYDASPFSIMAMRWDDGFLEESRWHGLPNWRAALAMNTWFCRGSLEVINRRWRTMSGVVSPLCLTWVPGFLRGEK